MSAHVAREAERVARAHGARFHSRDIPGEGWCYWFTVPDGGRIANRMVKQAILEAIEACGLDTKRLGR